MARSLGHGIPIVLALTTTVALAVACSEVITGPPLTASDAGTTSGSTDPSDDRPSSGARPPNGGGGDENGTSDDGGPAGGTSGGFGSGNSDGGGGGGGALCGRVECGPLPSGDGGHPCICGWRCGLVDYTFTCDGTTCVCKRNNLRTKTVTASGQCDDFDLCGYPLAD